MKTGDKYNKHILAPFIKLFKFLVSLANMLSISERKNIHLYCMTISWILAGSLHIKSRMTDVLKHIFYYLNVNSRSLFLVMKNFMKNFNYIFRQNCLG